MGKEDFTIFVGNLHDKVTEEILYELFVQAGPLDEVRIPSHNGVKKSYGFVQFKHEISVPYALRLMDGVKVYGRGLKLNSRSKCLHLYRPPAKPLQIERQSTVDDQCSPLRTVSGLGKRFTDKSLLPTGPSKKVQKMREDSSDEINPLRFTGGLLSKRFKDNSMLPSGPSRTGHYTSERLPPSDSWSPKHYPSQFDDTPKGYERGMKGQHKNRNQQDRGMSNHPSKSHQKVPYYNEKHHSRDKTRFDSYPSQRPRHSRPFTR